MPLFSAVGTESRAQRITRGAEPWIQRLARMGYAAKGLVYLVVGGLALQVALGRGGRTTGSEGALRTILHQPFGWVLLGVVAVGLAGYALWRFVQAALDPEDSGEGTKGIGKRAAFAISGIIHAGLALEAMRMAMGFSGGGGSSDSGPQHWTSVVLAKPLGQWLIAGVGLGIVVYGGFELVRAYRTHLSNRLDLSRLGSTRRTWVVRFGRLGLAARGVVFGVIGSFLIRAALQYDSSEARGLGGALASLREQVFGRWLLGLVAIGLAAYGMLELIKARFRRIDAA